MIDSPYAHSLKLAGFLHGLTGCTGYFYSVYPVHPCHSGSFLNGVRKVSDRVEWIQEERDESLFLFCKILY